MIQSPHQRVFSIAPDLSKLRVFGCPAYAFVDPSLRTKLDDRAVEGIYVGHEENSSAYLIYQPSTNKLIRSGQVRFTEDLELLGKAVSSNHFQEDAKVDLLDMDKDWSTLPSTFIDTEYLTDINRIVDHSIYYSQDDEETYGIVKITTSSHPQGCWVYFRSLFHPSSPSNCSAMWEKYITSQVVKNTSINQFYPIFTRVNVRTDRRHSVPLPAYIVSTDSVVRDGKRYPYGVGFVDNNHEPQDVQAWQVAFPDIAMATKAGPDGKKLVNVNLNHFEEPRSYRHACTVEDSEQWIAAT